MTCSVTNSSIILFINGKCHVRKLKSCRTGLAGYYACLSCELLLIPLGWGRTHRHTYTNFLNKRNIKKHGMCRPVAGMQLV